MKERFDIVQFTDEELEKIKSKEAVSRSLNLSHLNKNYDNKNYHEIVYQTNYRLR